MVIFFSIPFFLIVFILLFILFGVATLVNNLAIIFYDITVGVFIFLGVAVGIAIIINIKKTKRIYLIFPAIAFFVYCCFSIIAYRILFCLSEKYFEGGISNLHFQSNKTRCYAILLALGVTVCFILLMIVIYKTKRFILSIICCMASIFVLVASFVVTYNVCNQSYYEKHSVRYESIYVMNRDVDILWKRVNASEDGYPYVHLKYSDFFVSYKLKEGEMVYGTGQEMGVSGENYIEVFNDHEIGYVPKGSVTLKASER